MKQALMLGVMVCGIVATALAQTKPSTQPSTQKIDIVQLYKAIPERYRPQQSGAMITEKWLNENKKDVTITLRAPVKMIWIGPSADKSIVVKLDAHSKHQRIWGDATRFQLDGELKISDEEMQRYQRIKEGQIVTCEMTVSAFEVGTVPDPSQKLERIVYLRVTGDLKAIRQ